MSSADTLGVLVIEADPGAASQVSEELVAAGHRVVRCHDSDREEFPCSALATGSSCPLDGGGVDLVLDVRSHPRSRPTVTETGVTCALRDRLPLVVAGRPAFNPFEAHAVAVVDSTDPVEIVRACEETAASPLTSHSEVGTEVARSAVSELGLAPGATEAVVTRHHGTLRVALSIPGALPESELAAVSSHVVQAIRAFDSRSVGVDVRVIRTV
ncbi:MAG: hypothetical protein R3A49_00960 [Acidimicrobiia bacterium]